MADTLSLAMKTRLRVARRCLELIVSCNGLLVEGGDSFWEGLQKYQENQLHIDKSIQTLLQCTDTNREAARALCDFVVRGWKLWPIVLASLEYFERAEAAYQLQEGLESYPRADDIYSAMGVANMLLGNTPAAITFLSNALLRSSSDLGTGLHFANLAGAYAAQGQFKDALNCYKQSQEIFERLQYAEGLGELLYSIGAIHIDSGSYLEAQVPLERAIEIFTKRADLIGLVSAYGAYGDYWLSQSQFDQSKEFFEKQLALAREIDDRSKEAAAIGNLGLLYTRSERYDLAETQFEQQLKLVQSLADDRGMLTALSNLGYVQQSRFAVSQAEASWEAALELANRTENQFYKAKIFGNLAHLNIHYAGELETGLYYLRLQLRMAYYELKNKQLLAKALLGFGQLNLAQNQFRGAIWQFLYALQLSRECGDQELIGAALNAVGEMWAQGAEYDIALTLHNEAYQIASRRGSAEQMSIALSSAAGVYLHQSRYREALDYYQQALALSQKRANQRYIASDLGSIASVFLRLRRFDTALDYSMKQLQIAQQIEDRELLASAYRRLGRIQAALGERELEKKYLDEARRLKGRYFMYERASADSALGKFQALSGKLGLRFLLMEHGLPGRFNPARDPVTISFEAQMEKLLETGG